MLIISLHIVNYQFTNRKLTPLDYQIVTHGSFLTLN